MYSPHVGDVPLLETLGPRPPPLIRVLCKYYHFLSVPGSEKTWQILACVEALIVS